MLSVFAFNVDWAYTVDIYALLALLVRPMQRVGRLVRRQLLTSRGGEEGGRRRRGSPHGTSRTVQAGWFCLGLAALIIAVRERR